MLPFVDLKINDEPYLLHLASISRIKRHTSDGMFTMTFIGDDDPMLIDGEDFSKIRRAIERFNE